MLLFFFFFGKTCCELKIGPAVDGAKTARFKSTIVSKVMPKNISFTVKHQTDCSYQSWETVQIMFTQVKINRHLCML